MSWATRMNSAIDYIEQNLSGPLAIEDIADTAYCSKYHFHRVFYSCFNVTVSEYIRQRRFTLAAVDVVTSDMSIVDIALKYGYVSPNAFTRAFRAIHGTTPSKARATKCKLASHSRVSFPSAQKEIENMDYKIIQKPSFTIAGKSKRFKFDEFVKQGPKFWKEYVASDQYKAVCRLTNGQPGQVTNAPLLTAYFPMENNKRDEFIDVFGVELPSDKKATPFEVHSVPSASYAEFHCSYKDSMKTNRYIYSKWFAATGYERDEDKPDIVSYFSMPYQHFSEMAIRWWIPIVDKR